MNSEDDRVLFECIKCGACCREDSLLVTVTGRDIVRISLGLGVDEVIRALDFYLLSGEDTPEGLRAIPAVNTEQGRAYIALKKLENGDCIFLKDNLCMIHAIRPGVCMSFPFVFWNGDDEKTWGLSAMKEICQGLGAGPEVESSDLRELADAVLEDIELFKRFVKEWNQDEKNPTAGRLVATILSDTRFAV